MILAVSPPISWTAFDFSIFSLTEAIICSACSLAFFWLMTAASYTSFAFSWIALEDSFSLFALWEIVSMVWYISSIAAWTCPRELLVSSIAALICSIVADTSVMLPSALYRFFTMCSDDLARFWEFPAIFSMICLINSSSAFTLSAISSISSPVLTSSFWVRSPLLWTSSYIFLSTVRRLLMIPPTIMFRQMMDTTRQIPPRPITQPLASFKADTTWAAL